MTRPTRVRPKAIGVAKADGLPADLSSRDEDYLGEGFGR